MTTLFTVSLLLLIALFSVKIYEVSLGERLFFSHLRARADEAVTAKMRTLAVHSHKSFRYSRQFCTECLSTARHRLSDWLEGLARKLRQ